MPKTKLRMKVSEVMNKRPVITTKDELLPKAARKMLSNNVGCLIVKEKDNLLGIVTEKDIVEGAVGKELNIKKTKVKDVMTTLMVTVSPDANLSEAIKKMEREDVRRLPVIKGKKLVGLLTIKDILRLEPRLLECFESTLIKKK
ncbi:MAG: CBS domain-containing protein [Candidatus Woesearchaeota archaeon]